MNKCISITIALTILFSFTFGRSWANMEIVPYYPSEGRPWEEMSRYVIPIAVIGAGVALGVGLYYHFTKPSPVEFQRENVSINLFQDYVQVEGTYTLANPSFETEKIKVKFPMVIDHQIGEPYSISLLDDTGDEIPYREIDEGIQFEYEMPPGEHQDIHITYKQPYYSNEYTYILTSTKSWGKPLEVARFTVNTAGSLGELNSNYPFTKVSENELFSQYFYQTQDFYPDQELELSWE